MRPSVVSIGILALAAPALLGAPCAPLDTIVVTAPARDALTDDPQLAASARAGRNFGTATLEVRLDGVDLVAALALTPPFFDAAGSVLVGADLIDVSGFTIDDTQAPMPIQLELDLDGLPVGTHLLEFEGTVTATSTLVTRSVAFERVLAFTQEAAALDSGALHGGPVTALAGILRNASLGQPLAAGPIGLAGGGSVRSGIVEVSQALGGGSGP
jgi:hypothetical protein